ncbi:MAG: CPBP family intramembrane metalloprotease [Clostridia bacterium]|nr:CPBP family intramembrane metalloprotease [Clostridia bacterium]
MSVDNHPRESKSGASPIKKAEELYARYIRNRTVVLHPTVLVLATYVLLLLSKIVDLTLVNRENEYYSVVILQMMIFLLPGAIWCRFSGENYLSGLRLRLFRLSSLPLILSASLLMASGGLLLGVLFGGTEALSQSFSLYDTFISKNNGSVPNTIYLVLAYAILPSICEELIYRGILCREYESGGVLRAVTFSTLFFALLHFNLENLPVYLFSGAILAMTLYATRSLLGSMLAHFLYNLFGLFGQPFINNLYRITGSTELFLFLTILLFLISAGVFCGEASRLYRGYLWRGYSSDYRKPILKDSLSIRNSYLSVLKKPSAIACFAVYLIALLVAFL